MATSISRQFDPLERAREAIRLGHPEQARRILVAFLERQPRNAAGWRLLAQCVEQEAETIFCLERALKLDPADEGARRALARLHRQRPAPRPAVATKEPPPAETQPVQVAPAAVSEPPPAETQPVPVAAISPREPQAAETQPVPVAPPTPAKAPPLPWKNGPAETQPAPLQKPPNWPLALGLLLVALVLLLALTGPSLAPRDPLEEHNIFQIQGQWHIPPLDPLTPGYPLGTDTFGRDLYSRLLWAVRPTLVMVAIVALVRLALGLLIGLLAGWLDGRPARTLDALLQAALSVPVLLVALGAIAAIGVELGLWAFILGLSLTGWVETAQQVREQTRIVKGQAYIEAAHALGASHRQILLHHVLKQLSPMLAMLFAFEVSSTLMATAGLGFLGYYIGGDVWVTVDDFVARRISGMPELGQMLATSWVTLTRPWAMVATGTLVFTTVLGFNLVGEGLRLGLNLNVRRRGIAARLGERAGLWLDQHVWHPAAQVAHRPAVRTGLAASILLVLLISAGASAARWIQEHERPGFPGLVAGNRSTTVVNVETSSGGSEATPSLEGQMTAEGQTDGAGQPEPFGGLQTASPGQPGLVWFYQIPEGSFDRPVVSPDGTIYLLVGEEKKAHVLGQDGELRAIVDLPASPYTIPSGRVDFWTREYSPVALPDGTLLVLSEANSVFAVSPEGSILWEAALDADPAHPPVIGSPDRMYLTDGQGGLYAFDASGLLWRFQSEAAPYSANGLAVAPDGRIYYVVTNRSLGIVQAVSSSGEGLWATQVKTADFYNEVQVSQNGQWIALGNDLLDAQTGERLSLDPPVRVDEYFFGEDGRNYLRSVHTVMAWQLNPGGLEILNSAAMGEGNIVSRPPRQARVDQNGMIWMYYPENLVWMSQEGEVLGTLNYGWGPGVFITEDYTQSRLVNCHHFQDSETLECQAYAPGSDTPVWKTAIRGIPFFISGELDGDFAYLSDGARLTRVYLGDIE